jgi:hypothetical protein
MLRVICCVEPSGCVIVWRVSVPACQRMSPSHEMRDCGELVHFGPSMSDIENCAYYLLLILFITFMRGIYNYITKTYHWRE